MHFLFKVIACVMPSLFCLYKSVYAQTNVTKYQFGIGVGAFIYQGDLTPSSIGSYKTLKPAITLFASRLFSPSFAVRANLAFGQLRGDDAKYDNPEYRQQRNFNFHTAVIELSGLAEWNILAKNYTTRGFAPYVFGGIGYGFLKIRRDWSNLNVAYFGAESDFMTNLSADAQYSLPKGVLVLPVGIGGRYYLNDKIIRYAKVVVGK